MSNPDRRETFRLLAIWAVVFFFIYIGIWFLHEVAHGFGYQLDGTHVSTGFNLVGASGKKPSDSDFDVNLPVEGMSTGVLLGPFTTWMLAILFTGILLHRPHPNQMTLVIGAAAVSNAFMRLMPLTIFFIAAIFGNTSGVWQDEQEMSLGAIESIDLPISESELRDLRTSEPSMFMGDVGSLSMGGTLGTVAVITKQEILLAIVGGIFVLEALSVIIQVAFFKMTGGKRVFLMAPFHHHFEKKGWSEPKVVVRFWIISIILGLMALATLKLR